MISMRGSSVGLSLFLAVLLGPSAAHAIDGRIGLHGLHLEPNGGAEELTGNSWGGGLEVVVAVPGIHHTLGADFGLEFADLASETTVLQESEFDFRRELTTSQNLARIALGLRAGPHGRGSFNRSSHCTEPW